MIISRSYPADSPKDYVDHIKKQVREQIGLELLAECERASRMGALVIVSKVTEREHPEGHKESPEYIRWEYAIDYKLVVPQDGMVELT